MNVNKKRLGTDYSFFFPLKAKPTRYITTTANKLCPKQSTMLAAGKKLFMHPQKKKNLIKMQMYVL